MRICKLFILFILLFGCGDKDPESDSIDVDRDGVVVPEDCNDTDASMPIYDQDCDGILTEDDCVDARYHLTNGLSKRMEDDGLDQVADYGR